MRDAQRCGLRRNHGFREASKTRRTPYSTPAHQPLDMRAVHEARGKPDGVYFGVNDGRLPQRDTVMRSIYKGKRSNYNVELTKKSDIPPKRRRLNVVPLFFTANKAALQDACTSPPLYGGKDRLCLLDFSKAAPRRVHRTPSFTLHRTINL